MEVPSATSIMPSPDESVPALRAGYYECSTTAGVPVPVILQAADNTEVIAACPPHQLEIEIDIDDTGDMVSSTSSTYSNNNNENENEDAYGGAVQFQQHFMDIFNRATQTRTLSTSVRAVIPNTVHLHLRDDPHDNTNASDTASSVTGDDDWSYNNTTSRRLSSSNSNNNNKIMDGEFYNNLERPDWESQQQRDQMILSMSYDDGDCQTDGGGYDEEDCGSDGRSLHSNLQLHHLHYQQQQQRAANFPMHPVVDLSQSSSNNNNSYPHYCYASDANSKSTTTAPSYHYFNEENRNRSRKKQSNKIKNTEMMMRVSFDDANIHNTTRYNVSTTNTCNPNAHLSFRSTDSGRTVLVSGGRTHNNNATPPLDPNNDNDNNSNKTDSDDNEIQNDETMSYTYQASGDSKYETYAIHVDRTQDDKACEIAIFSFDRPHMRAFHYSWLGFFVGFFIWYAITPVLNEVKKSLDLTKEEVWTSSITGVTGTIFIRLMMGPMCDVYGARISMGVILTLASIPTGLFGIVQNAFDLALLRFFVSIAGSCFVMCQYWTSTMFTKEVAGTANALAAGWGNLGGGMTQVVMGSILFPLFRAIFEHHSSDTFEEAATRSWRMICIIPAVMTFFFGVQIIRTSDDCPKGNYAKMKKLGLINDVSVSKSMMTAFRDRNTWPLFIQYACCFGVELTVNNAAALYFQDEFGQTTESAAAIASVFGWMNLFARGAGGLLSDVGNASMGMRGRLIWQSVLLVVEGFMIVLFAMNKSMAGAIVMMAIFSIFVQAAEGSTYGIVPYVNPAVTGSIAGIIGAGGSCGAVVFGFMFRDLSYFHAFVLMGLVAASSSVLSLFVVIRGHAGIMCGQDAPELRRTNHNNLNSNLNHSNLNSNLNHRLHRPNKPTVGTGSRTDAETAMGVVVVHNAVNVNVNAVNNVNTVTLDDVEWQRQQREEEDAQMEESGLEGLSVVH